MEDIRKITMTFVIGILFSIFVFSMIDAIYIEPVYNDFCNNFDLKYSELGENCTPIIVTSDFQENCSINNGRVEYKYNSSGCISNYECETCGYEYDLAKKKYNNIKFYISGILAIIAIFIGLYLPANKNNLNEWIGSGFMLGGIFALFFGTISSYQSLALIIRPIIILFELVLIIFISYKKIDNFRTNKK